MRFHIKTHMEVRSAAALCAAALRTANNKNLTRNGQNTETDSIFDNLCESKNNLSSQKSDCHMSTTSLLKEEEEEEEEEEDLNVDGDTIVPYGYGTYL